MLPLKSLLSHVLVQQQYIQLPEHCLYLWHFQLCICWCDMHI